MPHFIRKGELKNGYRIHIVRARNKASIGAARNGKVLAEFGVFNSLVNNFNASAIGCGMPIILTLLGPFRSWMYPRTFRSSRVKNAIARRAQRKIVIMVIIVLINIVLG